MITIYEDDVVRVRTEVLENDLFVHFDVLKKDRQYIEQVISELTQHFLSEGITEVFCTIQNNNNKLKEFASYYKFVKDYDVEGTDYEVWVKELS